ncbi:LexA repressor-like protein [Paenibacillus larvae subsp. larvae DSM 25430]|nr:LexA repressor-like protein [Paenibacillus larvae subsp. larvae DSM 25430]
MAPFIFWNLAFYTIIRTQLHKQEVETIFIALLYDKIVSVEYCIYDYILSIVKLVAMRTLKQPKFSNVIMNVRFYLSLCETSTPSYTAKPLL